MRFLIADNHIVIRGGLRALLQMHGNLQICGEASNGREAVELAIRKRPDVVVINLNLPGVSGIEATRRIRKDLPGTEVLIFTADDSVDLMREALRAGARDVDGRREQRGGSKAAQAAQAGEGSRQSDRRLRRRRL